jgi:TolB-like protein/Tfp pilus assembly protein PilF
LPPTRSNGVKIKVPEQSFQILTCLLEHPGEVVTRKELEEKLWPDGTFVDFEHSLNAAVKRLREALHDSADTPRFVETIPRRGYRFICPVEGLETQRRHWVWVVGLATLAVVTLLLALNVGGMRDRLLGRPLPGEITSIAVLPLENLSGDPEQEYFADGMHEALITELGKVKALRVISRQSVMQFKGSKEPLGEIAGELGVDALVEGAVVREGDRVRVTAQVVRASPEQHLWAESYERDLRGIVALQGEVARAIVGEIRVELTPQEQTRLAGARPVDAAAYEAYLKGRYHWSRITEEGHWKSIDYFQQAIERDPDYAPAYAGLAQSYFFLSQLRPPGEMLPRVEAAAAKALELDDALAEAHALRATVAVLEWDWAGAEDGYRRALELNPNEALVHLYYAQFLNTVGRHQEALVERERAEQLDPLSPFISANVIAGLSLLGRNDEALEQAQKALELEPNFWLTHILLGNVYQRKGMHAEAILAYQRAASLGGGGYPWPLARLAHIYGINGRKREALEALQQLKEISKQQYVEPAFLAYAYAGIGEKEEAFRVLEKAYEEKELDPFWFAAGFFDLLRDDPRFQELLRGMNFPAQKTAQAPPNPLDD